MMGNYHVRFLEGKGGAIPPTYSTANVSPHAINKPKN